MKPIVIVIPVLTLLLACNGPKAVTPEEAAIRTAVARQLGELQSFELITLELVDSSTFAQEIERRRSTLETRRSQNLKIADRYAGEKKPRNAERYREKARQDAKNLEGLAKIEERMAESDSLGLTELYVYRFSANAKLKDGAKSEIRDFHAGITPEGEVIGLAQKEQAVYKGTGALLPGYREIFDQ